jgi:hypothetical protein
MSKQIHISQVEIRPRASRRHILVFLVGVLTYFVLAVLAIVLIVAYMAGVYACFILGQKTFSPRWDQVIDVEAAKTFFPSLIAVIGAPLLIWRVVTSQLQATAAQHQVRMARQTHYTDLFTKAVEQLGAARSRNSSAADSGGSDKTSKQSLPNIEVRLGAIFTLERIAQESEQDYWPVMEVLCAYLRSRENTGEFIPLHKGQDIHDWIDEVPPLRLDIQAALTVLGRRSCQQNARKQYDRLLDLTGAVLQRASFESGDFRGIDLTNAHLENARFGTAKLNQIEFDGAHLQHSRFFGAEINSTSFQHANLYGAQFSNARLDDVFFWDTELEWADFDGSKLSEVTVSEEVNLKRANLFDADFSGVEFDNADFLDGSLGDGSTKIPTKASRPASWPMRKLEEDERFQWMRQPRKPPTP